MHDNIGPVGAMRERIILERRSRRTTLALSLADWSPTCSPRRALPSRAANEGDVIVVPGKVLGAGAINKKLTVAAFRFSASAVKKIEEAGGRQITRDEGLQSA